jgi:hypothetical protein
MTTTTALAINIPLMVLFLALWTGIPLWLVFKRPDRGPATARTVPAYRRAQHAQPVQPTRPAYAGARMWRADRVRVPVSR